MKTFLRTILGMAALVLLSEPARAYITTSPGGGNGGGSPTNGITAGQAGSQIASTNTADIIPRINAKVDAVSGTAVGLTIVDSAVTVLDSSGNFNKATGPHAGSASVDSAGQLYWPSGQLFIDSSGNIYSSAASLLYSAATGFDGTRIQSSSIPDSKLVGPLSLSLFNTNVVIVTNLPATAGQALVVKGTNSSGQMVVAPTNWPTGGGSVPSGLVTNLAPADIVVTNAGVATDISSNSITTGTINVTQANIGTSWLTNTVSPTNAFGGTVVDFSKGYDGTTNLGGNLTFTAVANVTAGAENSTIIHLLSGGADRTIAFPVNWHTNFNFIGVLTNGWEMDLLFTLQPGIRTNVAQLLYP
jgi:hypothetical protein